MAHPHNEAGRRLFAAVMSCQLHIGLDYCLERYVPEQVDDSWCELAWNLQQHMANHICTNLLSTPKGSTRTH